MMCTVRMILSRQRQWARLLPGRARSLDLQWLPYSTRCQIVLFDAVTHTSSNATLWKWRNTWINPLQMRPNRDSPDTSTIYQFSFPFFFHFANFLCTCSRSHRLWQRYAATLPDSTANPPPKPVTSLTTIQPPFPVHSFVQDPLPAHPFDEHLGRVDREEDWAAEWTASVQKALATMIHYINSASTNKIIDLSDHDIDTDIITVSSKSVPARSGTQMLPQLMTTAETSIWLLCCTWIANFYKNTFIVDSIQIFWYPR